MSRKLFPTHLLPIFLIITSVGTYAEQVNNQTLGYLPDDVVEYRPMDVVNSAYVNDGSRRALAPFQLCLQCKCCAANAPNNCSSMPCCFGISCNLPDKPYGVCAFVPKTCNCTSCA